VGNKIAVCFRPDGEGADQTDFPHIAEEAKELNVKAHYLLIIPGQTSDEQVAEFGRILQDSLAPSFAYCHSGARATMLWALNQAQAGRPVDEILGAAKMAGHDLMALAPRLIG
jgi:sulfide:quinone oxidoreductase